MPWQSPQLSGGVPSLFLGSGLYHELSTPALWWDMEAGFGHQGRDQDKGCVDWTREEVAFQASSECAFPSSLACVETPMNTSSHPSVYTLPVCVFTPALCL